MIDLESLPHMTRQQAVEFLRGRGFPVSLDAINRDPPTPMGRWGKNLLYEPRELLAWASRRMKLEPRSYNGTSGT